MGPKTFNRYRRQQDDAAEDDSGVVDLHSQEFCVDVSTYGPVEFEPVTREKCDTIFNKRCETKTDQVGGNLYLNNLC